MRIAVFGAGGVGGYFGGRLAQAGHEVIFIARGRHLDAIRQSGLHVASLYGDFTVQPAAATDDPAAVGPVDVVLVATKAWQVPAAARAIRPLVGPDTVVVPLQNGVEAPGHLAAVLGAEPVTAGLCGLISYIEGPGRIRHAGALPFVRFGEVDNRPSPRLERLLDAFAGTVGVDAEIPTDIHVAVWQKFVLIVAWSGVGAVTRAPVGAILQVPESRRLLQATMEEVDAVARAQGVVLPDDIVALTFDFLEAAPAGGTASMQRDIMAGRPSELETQTGAVVRLGKAAGVPTPVNEVIYGSLLPLELHARGSLDFAD